MNIRDTGGPSVINLSLRGPADDFFDEQIAAAVRAGVVVCVAAGNALPGGIPVTPPLTLHHYLPVSNIPSSMMSTQPPRLELRSLSPLPHQT